MDPTYPSPKVQEKILVYLFGSLGDSLVAIPAMRAIRRHFGSAEIVVLQNSDAEHTIRVSEVMPADLVDRYISYSSLENKFLNFLRLGALLRREGFDAAVFLALSERLQKAVRRDRFFFRFSGISRLYGFNAFTDEELYPKETDGHPAMTDHEAVRKLKRLKVDGIPYHQADLKTPFFRSKEPANTRVTQWLSERRQKPGSLLISIAPGSKAQASAWPTSRFIEIGRRLLIEKDCELLVVGGPAERKLAEQLVEEWQSGINSAGIFSVEESSHLLSACDLHIGVDTGTMHLAAAADTPCFILFSERANPGQWYPIGDGHMVLSHRVACAGCRSQTCPFEDHPCMNEITVEAAWQALNDFIEHRSLRSKTQVLWV